MTSTDFGAIEPTKSNREKIIDALLALLVERRIEDISLGDIAGRAGVSLADCRDEFGSVLGILAAFMKGIDRKVLSGGDADMVEEEARERLFDVLMRRLEALAPHKEAVRSLMRSACSDPALACALNGLAIRSQRWMLTAAGIDSGGSRGVVRAQGTALLFACVLRTWVNDDDPGLARTMAALDRELARGQRFAGFFDRLCGLIPRPGRWRSRRDRDRDGRRPPRDYPGDEPITAGI
jgi:AcrR family transcriptional regulator